jgi:hypothetical protein
MLKALLLAPTQLFPEKVPQADGHCERMTDALLPFRKMDGVVLLRFDLL